MRKSPKAIWPRGGSVPNGNAVSFIRTIPLVWESHPFSHPKRWVADFTASEEFRLALKQTVIDMFIICECGHSVKPIDRKSALQSRALLSENYSLILITTPEPTVRPPSRIAKRRPSSIAIGVISSTSISTLSPGIHISVPSGSLMMPVTSVVLK